MNFKRIFRKAIFSFLISFSFLFIHGAVLQKPDLLEGYDVKFYYIDVEVNNLNTEVKGNTQILVQFNKSDIKEIGIELSHLSVIDSILIENKKAAYTRAEDTIIISLSDNYTASEFCNIQVFYEFMGDSVNSRKGLTNRSINSGSRVTWSITEPFYAKNWFPCKQYLTDKADSVYIFLTVSDSLMAGSNGILSGVSNLGGNKKRYEWKTRYPTAFYLISYSVADYMDYSFYASTADGDSVLVQNFIYNDSSYFWSYKKDIDTVKFLIEAFSKIFGPYPFKNEKYGHCLAPAGGGMENQTMTTLSSFSFELVSHELAHQWFGDNVTCSDWQNIWINEGFASYGEILAYELLGTKDDVKEWLGWAQTSAKTATEGSIYIPDTEKTNSKRIFDHPLTYKKGALIIHLLRYAINNDELFFDILKEFQTRFKDSTASADDFKNLVEEKTQADYDWFFQQWYYGEGFPTINVSWEQNADTVFVYFEQTSSAPTGTLFFSYPLDLKLEYLGGDTIVRCSLTMNSQKVAIPSSTRVYNIIVDPDLWILQNVNGAHRIMPEDKHAYFSIFPNPAFTEIYIQSIDQGKTFQINIYDIKGVLRLAKVGSDAFTIVKVENFESGVYQVVITQDNYREIYQLVKT